MADSYHEAARRHRSDAKHLAADRRLQNAGYLIGFAAECLAKGVLEKAGLTIDRPSGFREHFPKLGAAIRRNASGRSMQMLSPILRDPDFLDEWNAECRYEAVISVEDAARRYASRQMDVDALFGAVGIP